MVFPTVQLRDNRPTHTQDARTISAYTCARFPLLFIAIYVLCVSLFGWTNDYKQLLFSDRNEYLFFCQKVHVPWLSDGSMNSRRMKFTVISTQ